MSVAGHVDTYCVCGLTSSAGIICTTGIAVNRHGVCPRGSAPVIAHTILKFARTNALTATTKSAAPNSNFATKSQRKAQQFVHIAIAI